MYALRRTVGLAGFTPQRLAVRSLSSNGIMQYKTMHNTSHKPPMQTKKDLPLAVPVKDAVDKLTKKDIPDVKEGMHQVADKAKEAANAARKSFKEDTSKDPEIGPLTFIVGGMFVIAGMLLGKKISEKNRHASLKKYPGSAKTYEDAHGSLPHVKP